jgi:antitoxin component YwqK of YwqJK toxin-antitoxin module
LLLNYGLNVNNILYLLEKQLKSCIMKKYIVIATVLLSGMIFAQNNKPKLEAVGDLVKATSFHDNGKVQQVGFYKNGKLQGEWISYDSNGNKTAMATYDNGQKSGKWFFWSDTVLSEVDYSNNQIASVKNWKHDALVIAE